MGENKPRKMIPADQAMVLLLDGMLQEIKSLSEQTKKISEQTEENKRLIMLQIPEGIIDPKNVVATTTPSIIKPPFNKKWFSVSVVSDGPDDCYIVVNTEKSSTTPYLLLKHETFEIDLGAPRIVDLYIHCDSGSANLRIRGVH